MKKVLLAIGIVMGGAAVFLGATFMILAAQGRLEGESLMVLSDNPVLSAFISAPEPKPKAAVDSEESSGGRGGDGASRNGTERSGGAGSGENGENKAPVHFTAPDTFSTMELKNILDDAKEARSRCEKEWTAVEVERAELGRLREDLTDRKAEIEKMMKELAAKKTEFDAARERFRQEVITIEENEDRNFKKLAELYGNMKDMKAAAQYFNDMDIDQAVKIIVRMDTAKAAKILPFIDADRVRLITEKLARFQERKKSGSGR